MQRTTIIGMSFLFLFCVGGLLLASEADELWAKAKALRKEAAIMAERGNTDEAERLERKSIELLEAAERMEPKAKERLGLEDRPGVEREVRQLKERLHDLLAKERDMQEANAPERKMAALREQIANTERELDKIQAHERFRAQAEKLENAARRMHHMRVAAENLKMAELHDMAHEVMEKAEALEGEIQAAKERLAAEMREARHRRAEPVPESVRDLREEVERLRAEVRELSERVKKR